jgi:hypothetical protein
MSLCKFQAQRTSLSFELRWFFDIFKSKYSSYINERGKDLINIFKTKVFPIMETTPQRSSDHDLINILAMIDEICFFIGKVFIIKVMMYSSLSSIS